MEALKKLKTLDDIPFSEHKKKLISRYNGIEAQKIYLISWFTGFADGESCGAISMSPNVKATGGAKFQDSFAINLGLFSMRQIEDLQLFYQLVVITLFLKQKEIINLF